MVNAPAVSFLGFASCFIPRSQYLASDTRKSGASFLRKAAKTYAPQDTNILWRWDSIKDLYGVKASTRFINSVYSFLLLHPWRCTKLNSPLKCLRICNEKISKIVFWIFYMKYFFMWQRLQDDTVWCGVAGWRSGGGESQEFPLENI